VKLSFSLDDVGCPEKWIGVLAADHRRGHGRQEPARDRNAHGDSVRRGHGGHGAGRPQLGQAPGAALAALTLATVGVMSASPLFWSFPTAFLKSAAAAAAAGIAIINSIANLGGFVIPFLVGSIKDATGSTAGGMYFIAALLFGGAVLAVAARFADRQSAAPSRH